MLGKKIGVGLIGMGTIGSEVVNVINDRLTAISDLVGADVYLKRIKDRPAAFEKPFAKTLDQSLFTTDDDTFFNDADISVVIELVGGEHPAYDYLVKAMNSGKHVVTANKEVIAKHHVELFELANKNNVSIHFEASVGGGIPIISPLVCDLSVNKINDIKAVVNGTTNFILTQMNSKDVDFDTALKEAQRLGYAESDPTNDIEGYDTRYKLAILASLAFNTPIYPDSIYVEGISRIASDDFRFAEAFGYTIKLLAIGKLQNESIEVRVHPTLVSKESPLANVHDSYNSIILTGDLTEKVTFTGRGAGPRPTSSAVVSDVIKAAQLIADGKIIHMRIPDGGNKLIPMDNINTKYYLRVNSDNEDDIKVKVLDVLSHRSIKVLNVSVNNQSSAVILDTTRELDIKEAIKEINSNETIVNNLIRIED